MVTRWIWSVPAIILGLYLGRIVSERFPGSWPAPLLITLGAIGISMALLRRQPLQKTWPLSLLLVYVLYPYPDPYVALAAAALTAIVWVLSSPPRVNLGKSGPKISRVGIVALMIVVGFLILYLVTIAPGLLPADSGEFQLIATELGLAHPPGFPLYTILAHLMTRLPFGATPAFRVNLFSVITSTLTLLIVYLTVQRLTNSVFAGLTSAIALGASTTFWAQATTTNIRSLTALFAALLFYLFIMITRADGIIPIRPRGSPARIQNKGPTSDSNDTPTNRSKMIFMALFVLVLVAGITHHASLVFIGSILIVFLIFSERDYFRKPRFWLILIMAGLIGLIPLLYLPVRGAAGALGAPADITTASGFLNHVFALGFRGDFFYFNEPAVLWERMIVMANVMAFQFPTLLLIFMIAGMILMGLRDSTLAVLLGGAFFLHTLVAASYRAPQTVEYMMPAYIPAVILLGYFVGEMNAWRGVQDTSGKRSSWQSVLATILMALTLILVVDELIDNLASYRWLHEQTDTRDYVQPVFEDAPENATILAGWHWVTPMRYLQTVEGIRPDVDIQYIFPTGEKYVDTWARRIQEALDQGKEVVATHYDESAYNNLPPSQPLGDAYLFRQTPVWQMPADYNPQTKELNGTIQLLGYKLEDVNVMVGQEAIISLAWQPSSELPPGTSLYVHLVGQDGQIYAQDDLPARFQEEGITFTQFRITPRPDTSSGNHTLYIGVNNPEIPSDQQNVSRIPLSQLDVVLASQAPFTLNTTYRPLAEDPLDSRLIGYDWDNTVSGQTRLYLHWQTEDGYRSQVENMSDTQLNLPDLAGPWGVTQQNASISIDQPATYVPFGQGLVWITRPLANDIFVKPGQEWRFMGQFAASTPVIRDLIVSLRLVGYEEDGIHWAWWDLEDGVPAMGAIPTLKWIAGSKVQDPRWLTVDQSAWSEQQVEPLLRLYDAFSNRSLPILDERITEIAPWIPLGQMTVMEAKGEN